MKFCLAFLAVNLMLVCGQYPTLPGQDIKDWIFNMRDNPERVAENVHLVFTPSSYNAVYFPLKDLPYFPNCSFYDPSRPTVIYVHGWLESGAMDLSVLAIRGAYMDRNDHNVLSIDWSHYSKNYHYHLGVIPQLKTIAETVAEKLLEMTRNGFNIENLHLVGHSLGGQMVGKIGRHLKTISNNQLVVPRIYALDPAGPGFENHNIDGFESITRTDGAYVQIIHTCGGALGVLRRVGTIDFFPDGGSRHPGCDVDVTATILTPYQSVCDHARSWHFYQLSVRNPRAFPAIRCNSWDDFVSPNGTCWRDDIAFMGFGADTKTTGKYFLNTNANMFNLSRGMDGINMNKINITRLLVPTNDYYPLPIPAEVMEQNFL